METSLIEQKMVHLQGALQKLVDQYLKTQLENKKLLENINQLKQELDDQKQNLNSFQNQTEISKIVESVAEDEKKATELKNKINDYIKEIDKCIATLH